MQRVIDMQDLVANDNEPQQCEVCGWRDCNGHEVSSESGDRDTGIKTQRELEEEIERLTAELLKANQDHVALEGEIEKLKEKLMQIQTYALSKCQESDQQRMMISAYQKKRNA